MRRALMLSWAICFGLLWGLGVCFGLASPSQAATAPLPLSGSSSLLAGSSSLSAVRLALVDCALTPEDPACVSPSPSPSEPVSPSPTSTDSPSPSPSPSSAEPSPSPSSSCGSSDQPPCVVENTVEERSVFLLGLGLLVALNAAMLFALWGRE